MVSRHPVFGALAASLLLGVALAGGVLLSNLNHDSFSPPPAETLLDAAAPGLYFDYLVTIVMENKNLCELYTHCGGSASYMTSLADAGSLLLDYRYCNVNPSLPNYLCMSGGTTFGCTSNVDPNEGCATAAWNATNIVDLLEDGGVSWKAYMEDMPSNCYGENSGLYAVRHNPFMYYSSIVDNATRCDKVVPAGAGSSTLLTDLASTTTASNFMWLTPNNCNNMHDCSIAVGDAYLAALVPAILTTPVFLTERAALLVTFDEGYDNPTYAAWAGFVVKTAYTSNAYYDAYSYLKTIETNWGLPSLTSNDTNAAPMSEFFQAAGPDFFLTANPTSVSFVAGQSATSTVSLYSSGGFTGTVDLTTASAPAGVSAPCVPASISGSQTSTCTMSGSTPGSYTLTVTGTSGSLVHTTGISVTVTVPPTPDFSLTANPSSVSFAGGQSATSTISLTSTDGFTGTVDLTADSAPAGVTSSCVPTTLSGSQTSECTLSSSTIGSYTVTVTGTNGSLAHSTSISVSVTEPPQPDFSITTSPDAVSFLAGGSASSTISLRSTGGFTGTVSLTASSSPSGATTTCSPANISGSQASTCTLTGTAPGAYTVTVTGTNGTLARSTSIAVSVLAPGPTARFTVTPAAPHVNETVSFDASSSSDSDPGADLEARWDWEGDGTWDTGLSTTLTTHHVFTTEGRHTVRLQIRDSNGFTDTTEQSISVLDLGGQDKNPPQITITSPPDAAVVESTNVTVTGTASDDVGISAIELSTDNVTWTPILAATSWSASVVLEEGVNTIYARATDTSGNNKTVAVTVIAEETAAGIAPAPSSQNQALAAVLGVSPVIGLLWLHLFLWDRKRELSRRKKEAAEATSKETPPPPPPGAPEGNDASRPPDDAAGPDELKGPS